MKRLIFVIVLALLACIVSLVGCANNATQNDAEYSTEIPRITETDASQEPETQETLASESDKAEVINIIDRTVTEMIPTDSALELFWQDEFCDYYFPSIRSEYVIVELNNGDDYYVKEALECGIITIEDLDKYNIQYITVKICETDACD